jgi:hypothetical protein
MLENRYYPFIRIILTTWARGFTIYCNSLGTTPAEWLDNFPDSRLSLYTVKAHKDQTNAFNNDFKPFFYETEHRCRKS